MKSPDRNNVKVYMVFHVFLANTNNCGNNAYIPVNNQVPFDNFSNGTPPRIKEACTFGRGDQEVRFVVEAPSISAGASVYYASVDFNDPVQEKSEVDISSYYEPFLNYTKDDQRKFCFYNNVIGWTDDVNNNCHQ